MPETNSCSVSPFYIFVDWLSRVTTVYVLHHCTNTRSYNTKTIPSLYCSMLLYCTHCSVMRVFWSVVEFEGLHWGGLVTTCNQSRQTGPGVKKPHSWNESGRVRKAYCIIWPLKFTIPSASSDLRVVLLPNDWSTNDDLGRRGGSREKQLQVDNRCWCPFFFFILFSIPINSCCPIRTPQHRSPPPPFCFSVAWANWPDSREM